jgi:hypothetical protein
VFKLFDRYIFKEIFFPKEILKAEGFKPWSLDKMKSEASEQRQEKKI